MRSPSSYPGRASANAACACRHFRLPVAGRRRRCRRRARAASAALLLVRAGEAARASSALACAARDQRSTPPAASSRGICADEVRAGDAELRRKRAAGLVERRLLGHRRPAEGAAHGDAAEGRGRRAELPLDDLLVGQRFRCRHAETPRTMNSCSPGRTSPSIRPWRMSSGRCSRARSASAAFVFSAASACTCAPCPPAASASSGGRMDRTPVEERDRPEAADASDQISTRITLPVSAAAEDLKTLGDVDLDHVS